MKNIAIIFVLGLFVIPSSGFAMSLADVMTQYYVSVGTPKVLGASTADGGKTGVVVKKQKLRTEDSVTIIKGLRYSEGSPAIVKTTLKNGMDKSDDVKKLQLFLIAKGYLDADPTGKYGAQTTAALKKFQMDKGIKGDGTLVGTATRAAISAEVLATTPDVKQ
jgi:peptidoglycan hydrolase-like protein with peptidoglycan-binding domain